MMHVKEELCSLLLYKNHSLFKLADSGLLKRIKNGVYGNFLDPCPLVVCVTFTVHNNYKRISNVKKIHRDTDS